MYQRQPSEEQTSTKQNIQTARSSRIRFALLAILIFVNFANQYTFNNPQALEESMEHILGIDQKQFQLFYSLYALPNMFTVFFIGYLCDLYGLRISLVLLAGFNALFQLLIAIGGYTSSYYVILVGRALYGISSYALFIPHASMISVWFQGSEQALAMGIGITFPELGNALNSILTPIIFQSSGNLGDPLIFSFGLCVVGFGFACLAAYIDKRADRIDQENGLSILDIEQQDIEEINFSDLKKLKIEYWIIVGVCTAAMTLWIPFLDNVNRLFQKRFCYSQVSAGFAVTVAYLVAVFSSIPLGLIADKYGQRRYLAFAGLLVFFTAQLIILVFPQCNGVDIQHGAIAGLVFQGLGYAFYCNVMITSIPLVAKPHMLGTAFGVMQMIQSFFQFIVPIVTGLIVSNAQSPAHGYRLSSALFVILGLVGLGIGSFLFIGINPHYKKKLDRSSHENLLTVRRKKEAPEMISTWSNTGSQYENKSRDFDPLNLKTQSMQTPLLKQIELML